MEWVLILCLAVWLFLERVRIDGLERRLSELVKELGRMRRADGPMATAAEAPPVARASPAQTAPVQSAKPPVRPAPLAQPRPAMAARPVRHFDFSNWLAENGLAWLGGGALALGGLFLVVYASQRGFFTPPMRIAAAVLAGGLMLAASEWIRRQTRIAAHPLAAGAAAGAGGATLYGAIWSAQQLYHLIPFEMGAALIVLCSLGLLAYALLHGEALAVLALFGAFAAPVVTGISDWRSPAPEAFLTVIIVTGFAFSTLRRWPAAGYATIAGAFLWSYVSLANVASLKGALLLLAFAAGACLAVGWRARTDEATATSAFTRQPVIALCLASLLTVFIWWNFGGVEVWTGVITTGVLCAIAAVALVRGLIPAWAFAAPVGCAVLGLLLLGSDSRPLLINFAPLMLAPPLIAATGWAASFRLAGQSRLIALATAGLGAAVLATATRFLLERTGAPQPWAASAITSALMFAAAWALARKSQDAGADRGLALWLAGATELALLAIAGALLTAWEPAAQALAAAVLVVAALRLRWLGLAQGAVAAALIALAAMLRPTFMGPALDGAMPMTVLCGSTILAVAILFAAGTGLRAPERRTEAEALKTASLLIGLLALFLVIQRLLALPTAVDVSHHLAASLRTVLILAATLLLAITARPEAGWLSRWRLRLLLIAGLAHGLLVQSLWFSPWWGMGEPPVGLPLFNTLIVAYLAPALLLGALYRRRIEGDAAWTRAVAVGAVFFGALWLVLTVRHAFHPGAAMDSGPLMRNEACAYVVLLLAVACALVALRRRGGDGSAWLAAAAQPVAWGALTATAMVFWMFASPWWGVQGPSLSVGGVVLLFALYGVAAAAATLLQRLAAEEAGPGWAWLARAGAVTAVFTLFALATLMVRFAFHGVAMGSAADATGLETWAYSAVWALFGLGALVVGGLRRSYTLRWLGLGILLVTVAKVLVFDTSRLDGMIRAASFLGLGVLLIVGALAARRLNAKALLFATKAVEP